MTLKTGGVIALGLQTIPDRKLESIDSRSCRNRRRWI